jgi:hypothetical protein
VTLQLHVELEWVTPAAWRRLLVPAETKLSKLHDVLQAAMWWTDSHLHCFEVGDQRFGVPDPDWDDEMRDERSVTLRDALGAERHVIYEYYFGDSWRHRVAVEDEITLRAALRTAVCLDGENACPPEDCGGAPGYEQLLESLADPKDDQHDSVLEWLGGIFDPTLFSLAAANIAIQLMR